NGMVAPAYWLSQALGISYSVNVRVPERDVNSLAALESIPISVNRGDDGGQLLANLATVSRTQGSPVLSHYNVQPVIDIFGGISGRDLGGVLRDLGPLIEDARRELKETSRGAEITLRGQVETMKSSFTGLGVGLIMAIVLIYLLLVVNFHSWLDPFIIIMALPGALAGVVWGLYFTQTPLSVPALMGAIMGLGVATANSVLVVSFARNAMKQGLSPTNAALQAGATRLRAVLMTALAMMIGMLPMSLGLGDGGEQNAPLGRAVIGGLAIATFATLFFVPVMFSLLRKRYQEGLELAEFETPDGPEPMPA
ncbi:MAG TPA: efflux RND transporter permease subunit, partial [Verrucomicrobiaceae bacterium]